MNYLEAEYEQADLTTSVQRKKKGGSKDYVIYGYRKNLNEMSWNQVK